MMLPSLINQNVLIHILVLPWVSPRPYGTWILIKSRPTYRGAPGQHHDPTAQFEPPNMPSDLDVRAVTTSTNAATRVPRTPAVPFKQQATMKQIPPASLARVDMPPGNSAMPECACASCRTTWGCAHWHDNKS